MMRRTLPIAISAAVTVGTFHYLNKKKHSEILSPYSFCYIPNYSYCDVAKLAAILPVTDPKVITNK
jgi:hypothetical protein